MVEFSVHNSLGQSGIQQKEKSSCHTGISRMDSILCSVDKWEAQEILAEGSLPQAFM